MQWIIFDYPFRRRTAPGQSLSGQESNKLPDRKMEAVDTGTLARQRPWNSGGSLIINYLPLRNRAKKTRHLIWPGLDFSDF
jgi:hypothetical protein